MLLKLYAWLTGRKVVWLFTFDGEVIRTTARKTHFGLVVKRYFNLAEYLLLEDGTTNSVYVVKWKEE